MTLIADANTMITNGSTAATTALAIAPGGPINSIPGGQNLYLNSLKQIKTLLNLMKSATDAGDPNLTIINSDLATIG